MQQEQPEFKQEVRTLDERESYFSYILSPWKLKNKKKSKKNNRHKQPAPVRPLNERENYFSYVLSPWKKKNKKMNNNDNNNNNGNDLYKECPEGDVNCRAEVFIQEKHKKLKLGKMMPNLWSK